MKKNTFSIIALFLFTSTILIYCNQDSKPKKEKERTVVKDVPKDISIAGSFSPQTSLVFDSSYINIFIDSFPVFKSLKTQIDTFYKKRNFSFAWYDNNGMIEPADNLYNHILNISEEGLKDSFAYKTQLSNLMDMEGNNKKPSPMLDLMLTAQYLDYAKKVWSGVGEKKMTELEWLLPRKETSYEQLLDSLISGKDVLKDAPVYRQYSLLKDYLKKYNAIKTAGGWETIKADKKQYKIGDSGIVLSKVRKRLFVTGDLAENNESQVFDSSLQTAIKKYEKRFGHKDDGILTAALIAEMNVPVEKRIEQIIVNMERSRWVPINLQKDYLLINIPDYKLYAFENDVPVWNMNVVVGKDQHRTVIFNGDMKYIVFSPYWNITPSILKDEVLPAIKRNPKYLAQHNMEWNGGNVRQKPGPDNSLGLVKFLFPNNFNIYLHDSPAKSLFKEDQRAFSHGCIRLAEPKKLAQYILRNDPAWNEAKITAAMNKGVEQFVTLKTPVPVFIAYFTSWVDRQGNLNFRKDIYKRDQPLVEMILDKGGK
ncbi:MAG: L,D-transpeptidase family protein [Ferruginibacter sp.]